MSLHMFHWYIFIVFHNVCEYRKKVCLQRQLLYKYDLFVVGALSTEENNACTYTRLSLPSIRFMGSRRNIHKCCRTHQSMILSTVGSRDHIPMRKSLYQKQTTCTYLYMNRNRQGRMGIIVHGFRTIDAKLLLSKESC